MRDSWHVLLRATGLLTPVLHADNGAEGLQIMARHPGAWILLDSSLEDDAWQTLTQLRSAWPQARCLVVVHRAAQAERARTLGAHGIVPGNCSLDQLDAALGKLQADQPISINRLKEFNRLQKCCTDDDPAILPHDRENAS